MKRKPFKMLYINPVDIVHFNGLNKSSRTNIPSIVVTEKALKDYINVYISR